MNNSIRSGMTQAFNNEHVFKAFSAQVGLTAIGFGLQFKSWILFGVLFLIPIFAFMFAYKHKALRIIALVFAMLYTLGWAFAGYLIGSLFGISASIVLGLIGLLCGAGCNRGSLRYYRDAE